MLFALVMFCLGAGSEGSCQGLFAAGSIVACLSYWVTVNGPPASNGSCVSGRYCLRPRPLFVSYFAQTCFGRTKNWLRLFRSGAFGAEVVILTVCPFGAVQDFTPASAK